MALLWTISSIAKAQERTDLSVGRGSVSSVQFSPDGKLLAAAQNAIKPIIKVWDVASAKEVATITGFSTIIRVVMFSPDGKLLVTGGIKQPIILWSVSTWKERSAWLVDPSEGATTMAFSPDGKFLASSGTADGEVRLWSFPSGRVRAVFKGHTRTVNALLFTPDGKTLVTGSSDKTVRLWSIETAKEKAVWQAGNGIAALALSPDGKTLVTGSQAPMLKVWDFTNGKELSAVKKPHALASLAFSPDGKILALGADIMYLCDLPGPKDWARLKRPQLGYECIAFSPDGKRIAAGGTGDTICIWEVPARK